MTNTTTETGQTGGPDHNEEMTMVTIEEARDYGFAHAQQQAETAADTESLHHGPSVDDCEEGFANQSGPLSDELDDEDREAAWSDSASRRESLDLSDPSAAELDAHYRQIRAALAAGLRAGWDEYMSGIACLQCGEIGRICEREHQIVSMSVDETGTRVCDTDDEVWRALDECIRVNVVENDQDWRGDAVEDWLSGFGVSFSRATIERAKERAAVVAGAHDDDAVNSAWRARYLDSSAPRPNAFHDVDEDAIMQSLRDEEDLTGVGTVDELIAHLRSTMDRSKLPDAGGAYDDDLDVEVSSFSDAMRAAKRLARGEVVAPNK